ncbi:MAG: hypothetical protein CENE_00386 [Candidatus Celerinatantimonas neptuna]|nr:MAG: hypothetical protein CENE_00386 [Candidatus Celerinatantimonas neptuna]
MNRITILLTFFGCILATISPSEAESLNSPQKQVIQIHMQDAHTQEKIDDLDHKTRETLEKYQQHQRQSDLLNIYNKQLTRMIASQEEEKSQLKLQLNSLAETEQTALPFLVSLYQQLATLIHRDQPFLLNEREHRLIRLKHLIDQANISLAEKYRQVLNAYQIELSYANSIGSYQGQLNINGSSEQVRYFRLGRLALYYQTLDGQTSALWQPQKHLWRKLTNTQNKQLSIAIAMADKQHLPQLLNLPLPSEQEPKS